jgi:hypothetical protein
MWDAGRARSVGWICGPSHEQGPKKETKGRLAEPALRVIGVPVNQLMARASRP